MDGINKLTAATEVAEKEKRVAIIEKEAPGIWYQECCYASKPEWWTPPNVWQKLVVVDSTGTSGISDLFWNWVWFPLEGEMTMEELELSVRAIYPQFPEDIYVIHRM